MNKKVIGVFHSEEEAIRKVEELEAQGFNTSDIYAVAKDEDNISMVRGRTNIDVKSTGGNWFDRFVGFITGEEPVREALHNAGLDGPEMDDYYRDIDDGGILLYVDEDYGGMNDSTIGNMDEGPHNVHNVDAELHTGANFVPHSEPDAGYQAGRDQTNEETRMKLHEEKLSVDKEQVDSGEVRVRKHVVEEEQSFDVPVSREEVYIERRPVDEKKAVGEVSDVFEEDGQSIRIPLREEHVEVTKRPVVNEELIVGKKEIEDTETVRETVRREEADIDGVEETYGQHQDWGNNLEAEESTRNLDSGMNYGQNTNRDANARNLERDFGSNASSLDARMDKETGSLNGNDGFNEGLAEDDYQTDLQDDKMNLQNEYGKRSKLDEELEKRRAQIQARDYNPHRDENPRL